jgi:hypothetical protein
MSLRHQRNNRSLDHIIILNVFWLQLDVGEARVKLTHARFQAEADVASLERARGQDGI